MFREIGAGGAGREKPFPGAWGCAGVENPMPTALRSSLPARWYLGSVGAFLVALGLAFTWWLWQAGERAMITRHWVPVSGTVLASGIKESQFSPNDSIKWQAEVEYRYLYEGVVYHGSKLRRIEGPSPHRAKAEAAAGAYPAGREVACFVNPARPSEAVLEHSSKAAFYTLWWPLLFAVGGAGMMGAALRRPGRRETG